MKGKAMTKKTHRKEASSAETKAIKQMLTKISYAAHPHAKAAQVLLQHFADTLDESTLEKLDTCCALQATIRKDDQPSFSVIIAHGVTPISMLEHTVKAINGALDNVTTCRFCGCSETYACPGGCYWIEHDVCSHPNCVERWEDEQLARSRAVQIEQIEI